MMQETILAATLVVMLDGTTIQTPMESYIECQRSAKILKKEDRDAFCIPRQRETDRVRDMMWDFMDMIDAIKERTENGKCGGGPTDLLDDERFFEGRERCGPNKLCPKFNGSLGKGL